MIDIRLEMPYQNICRHRDTDFSRAENCSGKQTEKSENTHTQWFQTLQVNSPSGCNCSPECCCLLRRSWQGCGCSLIACLNKGLESGAAGSLEAERSIIWARDFLEGFITLRIWFTPGAVLCSFWLAEVVMWEGVWVRGEVCSDNKSGLCFLFVLNKSCNVIFFSGYLCVEGEGCYAVIRDALLFVEGLWD